MMYLPCEYMGASLAERAEDLIERFHHNWIIPVSSDMYYRIKAIRDTARSLSQKYRDVFEGVVGDVAYVYRCEIEAPHSFLFIEMNYLRWLGGIPVGTFNKDETLVIINALADVKDLLRHGINYIFSVRFTMNHVWHDGKKIHVDRGAREWHVRSRRADPVQVQFMSDQSPVSTTFAEMTATYTIQEYGLTLPLFVVSEMQDYEPHIRILTESVCRQVRAMADAYERVFCYTGGQ